MRVRGADRGRRNIEDIVMHSNVVHIHHSHLPLVQQVEATKLFTFCNIATTCKMMSKLQTTPSSTYKFM